MFFSDLSLNQQTVDAFHLDCHRAGNSDGAVVRDFERALAERLGISPDRVVVFNSCTAALHALGQNFSERYNLDGRIGLIHPRLTWPSTHSWWKAAGYPKHLVQAVDIKPDGSGTIRRDTMYNRCGPDWSVLTLFVELWGNSLIEDRSTLDNINQVFIVDAAHNVLDPAHVKILDHGCCQGIAYSFYATKQLTSIRGGAAILPAHRSRGWFDAFRDSGTVGRHIVLPTGLNYEMPDILAKIGLRSLESFDAFETRRERLRETYEELLPSKVKIRSKGRHLMVVEFDQAYLREEVVAFLRGRGIICGCHYPVHEWFNENMDWEDWKLSRRIATLPLHVNMDTHHVAAICHAIKEALRLI